MCPLSRRGFLQRGGAAAVGMVAAGTTGTVAEAMGREPSGRSPDELAEEAADQIAILFDSTLCIGCRACEVACNQENDLARSGSDIYEGRPSQDARALDVDVWSYTTFHQVEADDYTAAFGRVQCMHCIEPACVSSCPVHALEKLESWARRMALEPVPGMPLLHDGVSVSRPALRVGQTQSANHQV